MLAVLFAALLAAGPNESADAAPDTAAAPAPVQAQPSPPPSAQPPARAEAEPEPAPAPTPPPVDTLYFIGGGRVRGTVLEETPRHDVTIRLLDGTVRRYAREDLARIEYADGSVSRRRTPPPERRSEPPRAAEPPRYVPPPAPPYAPPRPPPYPVAREASPAYGRAPFFPLWGSIGIGATFFGGDARQGVAMGDELEPQVHLSADGGIRLSPAFGIGVYMDVGGGDPARAIRDQCAAQGVDCSASAGRFGLQLRHTWDPASPAAKWLSIGTGWEFATVSRDGGLSDLLQYTGREYVRLAGGIDFRQNPVVGVGLYGSVAFGEFRHLEDASGVRTPTDGALHTTVQAGVRLTLFP